MGKHIGMWIWIRWWHGAIKQLATTWVSNVDLDLWRHMVSSGHKELIPSTPGSSRAILKPLEWEGSQDDSWNLTGDTDSLICIYTMIMYGSLSPSVHSLHFNIQCFQNIEAWSKWPSHCRQHFQVHFPRKKVVFLFNFIEVCSRGSTDNMSALVQIMAWHQTGSKPLPETMLIHIYKAI